MKKKKSSTKKIKNKLSIVRHHLEGDIRDFEKEKKEDKELINKLYKRKKRK